MNIYKVTMYYIKAERLEYEGYFSSFKLAHDRTLWQLRAIGSVKMPRKWPKKPRNLHFWTESYHVKIDKIECNRTWGCVLGSWIGSYHQTSKVITLRTY